MVLWVDRGMDIDMAMDLDVDTNVAVAESMLAFWTLQQA